MVAKVFGIIAIKGGVGKTTTVSNLGVVLANDFNQKVAVIDANFSAPNLGLHLGIASPKRTIQDVLNNKAHIFQAIYSHHYDNLHIIPASWDKKITRLNPKKLASKIKTIKKYYDVILIDSSPALNDELLSTIVASDELIAITTPDYPTLNSTIYAIREAKKKKTPITGLIINKTRNKRFELNINDIEEIAEVPVLAILPDDTKVLESLAKTTPTTMYHPLGEVSMEYRKLAACLIGQDFNDKRMSSKLKKLFLKPKKQELNRELKKYETKLKKFK